MLKLSISRAGNMFDQHSTIIMKNKDSANFLMIKTESEIQIFPNADEKKKSKSSYENFIEPDVDNLDAAELRDLVRSMTAKQNMIINQNQDLFQEIEKLKSLLIEEKKEYEESHALQKKEIEHLQNMCKAFAKELNDSKTPIKQDGDQQILFSFDEIKKIKKIKKKIPDNSPDSILSKNEVDDSSHKWPFDKEYLNENSEQWQFQFQKIGPLSKKKIQRINVKLKNNSSSSLLIEDIRINSSESKIKTIRNFYKF